MRQQTALECMRKCKEAEHKVSYFSHACLTTLLHIPHLSCITFVCFLHSLVFQQFVTICTGNPYLVSP